MKKQPSSLPLTGAKAAQVERQIPSNSEDKQPDQPTVITSPAHQTNQPQSGEALTDFVQELIEQEKKISHPKPSPTSTQTSHES